MIEETKRRLPEIEANLRRLAQSPHDTDALEAAYRLTHAIGGTASIRGLRGLTYLAHGMEDILADVLDGLAVIDVPTVAFLMRELRRLARIVWGMEAGVNEEALIIAADDADYYQFRSSRETK